MPRCRFSDFNPRHTEPAVVRVKLEAGCLCYPDDREQNLCWQHLHKLAENGALGPWKVIKEYPDENTKLPT